MKQKRKKLREEGLLPPVEPAPVRVPGELDRGTFERMMDDGVEDTLRHVRDRLKLALDDESTPASALPAISRQLIAVVDRLEVVSGDGGLADLVGSGEEVTEELGASIV